MKSKIKDAAPPVIRHTKKLKIAIRARILERETTQQEVADAIDRHLMSVSRAINHGLGQETLRLVCEHLDLNPSGDKRRAA